MKMETNIKQVQRAMQQLQERSLQFAERQTLNDTAFAARAIYVSRIQRSLTERTGGWTSSGYNVKVLKAFTNKLQAELGNEASYAGRLEFGRKRSMVRRLGYVVIPSRAARDGGSIEGTVLSRFQTRNFNKQTVAGLRRNRKGSVRQQNAVNAYYARKRGGDRLAVWKRGTKTFIVSVPEKETGGDFRTIAQLKKPSELRPREFNLLDGAAEIVFQQQLPSKYWRRALAKELKRARARARRG